jgi:2-keto-4-pentenoate hydratase/2-oxohepta-3-ene-1,7-dioic acid hydratase in catechol pathway
VKYASVKVDGRTSWGFTAENVFYELGGPEARFSSLREYIAFGSGEDPAGAAADGRPWDSLEFLPVLPNARQIFCIGANYEAHRKEIGGSEVAWPTVFLRLPGSQVGHQAAIVIPSESDCLDYEGELAVVIGRGGRRIPAGEAMEHVYGYACYNDGSVRDWQKHTAQWTPGKNFVGTGGFGPYLVTADELPDIATSHLVTRVNGDERQRARISDMTYAIPELIAYLSTFAYLHPGDVICTGTPGGIGSRMTPPAFLREGDVVEVTIDRVGTLRNRVAAEVS